MGRRKKYGINYRDITRDTRQQDKAMAFVKMCLESGWSKPRLAVELGVHRNTLDNRLAKKSKFKPGEFAMIRVMKSRYKFLK